MEGHPYTRRFSLPSPPDADNDITEGYEVLDVVLAAGAIYDCLDNTEGAAVWQEREAAGGTHNHDADYADIVHTHPHDHDADYADISHTHSATFNDAEGDSSLVSTTSPSDGTSTYPARRDHAHNYNAQDSITAVTDATPADIDYFGFKQTTGNNFRRITWEDIKLTIKSYFDTLYSNLAHASRHEWLAADEITNLKDGVLNRVHPSIFKDWSDLNGLTASNSGTGSFPTGFFTTDVTTGATSGSRASVSSNSTMDLGSSATLTVRFRTRINPRTVMTSCIAWLGYVTNVTAPTATENHVAFKIDGGTIYASCGNGTTGNLVTTGVTTGQFSVVDLYIKEEPGSIKFYVNGVLTNTFTTNLPSVNNTAKLVFILTNSTAAARTIRLFPYWHSQGA